MDVIDCDVEAAVCVAAFYRDQTAKVDFAAAAVVVGIVMAR